MSLAITNINPKKTALVLTAQLVDAAGKVQPVPAGTTFSWQVSDPNIAVSTPSADGTSTQIDAQGPLGPVGISLTVSIPGVGSFLGSLSMEVVAAPITGVQIVPNTPADN